MTKKLLAVLLATLMIFTVMAGCTKTTTKEIWVSYSDYEEGGIANNDGDENIDGDQDSDSADKTKGKTSSKNTKRTKTDATRKVTEATGKKTRGTRAPKDSLNFTPVADAGADYDVKGTVSIAVDTVRPTDYDAMFDVMLDLYPNINFVFDYWTHNTNDDGREYLIKNMATGTAANIMWDEAGEIPTYIINGGWVKPITDYVAKDPEAKYIPANLKSDYTYYGELFAVPHQATFEITAINTKLVEELGIKDSDMPGLEWTIEEYEALLRKGANGFSRGICVGTDVLTEQINRVSSYLAARDHGMGYGHNGYNYATNQIEVNYVIKACNQFRAWRQVAGLEGWYMSQNKTSDGSTNLLDEKLGGGALWATNKALLKDTLTVYTENWDTQYPNLHWKQWTTPNIDGNLLMHIDHCFITSTTPDSEMDACYQALRFMTFTTNGNLARLTMYEDSQKGKYSLNSHVYHLTTTSPAAIQKFNNLSCTDEVDEYMVANIKNSSRYDTFKIVPGYRDAWGAWANMRNEVIDGTMEANQLVEPVTKINKSLKAYEKTFKEAFDKYYK